VLKINYGKLTYTNPNSNGENNRKRRKVMVIRLLQLMELDHQIIYIDECGVGSKPLRRWGWGNEENSRARIEIQRVKNLSVCTAISKKGMECIEFSSMPYDENRFQSFLMKMIDLLREKAIKTKKKFILLMDNAAFHKTESCLSLLRQAGMPVLFNPPYTPHLNICEYFFNDLKRSLQAQKPAIK
jgi:hypothetical protein